MASTTNDSPEIEKPLMENISDFPPLKGTDDAATHSNEPIDSDHSTSYANVAQSSSKSLKPTSEASKQSAQSLTPASSCGRSKHDSVISPLDIGRICPDESAPLTSSSHGKQNGDGEVLSNNPGANTSPVLYIKEVGSHCHGFGDHDSECRFEVMTEQGEKVVLGLEELHENGLSVPEPSNMGQKKPKSEDDWIAAKPNKIVRQDRAEGAKGTVTYSNMFAGFEGARQPETKKTKPKHKKRAKNKKAAGTAPVVGQSSSQAAVVPAQAAPPAQTAVPAQNAAPAQSAAPVQTAVPTQAKDAVQTEDPQQAEAAIKIGALILIFVYLLVMPMVLYPTAR